MKFGYCCAMCGQDIKDLSGKGNVYAFCKSSCGLAFQTEYSLALRDYLDHQIRIVFNDAVAQYDPFPFEDYKKYRVQLRPEKIPYNAKKALYRAQAVNGRWREPHPGQTPHITDDNLKLFVETTSFGYAGPLPSMPFETEPLAQDPEEE